MSNVEEIKKKLAEHLKGAEDEIIDHRVRFMLHSGGFSSRLKAFILSQVTDGDEIADNVLQEFAKFLTRELSIDGTE